MIEYVIKPVVDLPSKYYPLIRIVVGAIIGYISDVRGVDLLIVGLTASGVYSSAKTTVQEVKSRL